MKSIDSKLLKLAWWVTHAADKFIKSANT